MKDHHLAHMLAVVSAHIGLSLSAFLLFASITVVGVEAQTFAFRWGGVQAAVAASVSCGSTAAGDAAIRSVVTPQPYRVYQRDQAGTGQVLVSVVVDNTADCVEVQMVSATSTVVSWQKIASGSFAAGATVSGAVAVPQGGWYQVQVRAVREAAAGPVRTVDTVGVGDVFITAGQSNSTFWGSGTQQSATGKVSFFDGTQWAVCADPLASVDGGTGGSPWCPLGDKIVAAANVPVAFAPTGWGGTSIAHWQPTSITVANNTFQPPQTPGYLYYRLLSRVTYFGNGGFKAILWHQGEADAVGNTTAAAYQTGLNALISNIRSNAGFVAPWFVAHVTYFTDTIPYGPQTPVSLAQTAVLNGQNIFEGANTDVLVDPVYRAGGHFGSAGLKAHAQEWFQKLNNVFHYTPYATPTCTLTSSSATTSVGVPFTLTWSSTGATDMTPVSSPSVHLGINGQLSITPAAAGTTTYSYVFSGQGGNAWCTARVVAVDAGPVRIDPATIVALRFVGTGTFAGVQRDIFQGADGTAYYGSLSAGLYKVPQTGAAVNPTQSTWKLKAVADMNRDGNSDFVWQYPNGTVNIWYLNNVTYAGFHTVGDTGRPGNDTWQVVGAADQNGDTFVDLVWQFPDGTFNVWYLNAGNEYLAFKTWQYIGSGTFSGVKKGIFQHSDGTVYSGTSASSTPVPQTGPIANPGQANWKLRAVADMNRDGNSDFVWQFPNGTVNIWYLSGVNYSSFRTIGGTGTTDNGSWRIVDASNRNSDAYADFLWKLPDNTFVIWYLNDANGYSSTGTCPAYAWGVPTSETCPGSAAQSAQQSTPKPTISSFTASSTTITSGQSSLLSWVTSLANFLSIDQGIGAVTGTSKLVTPTATTTYTLSAGNAAGTTTASVTVAFRPTAPAAPTYATCGTLNKALASQQDRNAYLLPFVNGGDGQVPSGSVVALFENGAQLGPAHSAHADIRTSGAGRFSHWYNYLYFSSSDNSNPLTNGRTYTWGVPTGQSCPV